MVGNFGLGGLGGIVKERLIAKVGLEGLGDFAKGGINCRRSVYEVYGGV